MPAHFLVKKIELFYFRHIIKILIRPRSHTKFSSLVPYVGMEDGKLTKARQGNECRHNPLKFANIGLNPKASHPLNIRLINIIILGPHKIRELQDQRSSTVALEYADKPPLPVRS